MTFIAVDDEPLALKVVSRYAEQYPEWQLLATFTDATEALEYIRSNEVDLIISDINMPDISGLQFVKELGDEAPLIIFITAYKEHALEGFELAVTDYIMKPVAKERFEKAMRKAEQQCQLLKQAGKKIEEGINQNDHFFVHAEYEQVKIIIAEILYIEGMGDYVKIYLHTQSKPIITLERIKNLAELLYEKGFRRIHRSYIINFNRIEAKMRSKVKINDVWLPVGDTYQGFL